MRHTPLREKLLDVYDRMLQRYGPQHWWPGDTRFEVMVGAILTQAAAWANVEKAIANLVAAGALSPAALRGLGEEELARLVYPSGYFNSKARKLKALAEYLGPALRRRPGRHGPRGDGRPQRGAAPGVRDRRGDRRRYPALRHGKARLHHRRLHQARLLQAGSSPRERAPTPGSARCSPRTSPRTGRSSASTTPSSSDTARRSAASDPSAVAAASWRCAPRAGA